MKCPQDNTILILTERQNVEIDYCPDCRGIWLDRGELDKIIERLEEHDQRTPSREQDYQQPTNNHGSPRKKRESWLSELFD